MSVIPATQETEIESWFKANLGKKLARPPSQKTNWTWWNTAAISVMKEDQGLRPAPGKKPQDPTE
jgi:hypothetical protein